MLKGAISMTIYYLMIKTHKITGLRYLCQTTKNPYKYKGSGIDWKQHLKNYGSEHNTEILLQTSNWKELSAVGRYYSIYYNVTTSSDDFGNKLWANRIIECGGGGGASHGDKNPMKRKENKNKISGVNHWMNKPEHYDKPKFGGLGNPMHRQEVKDKVSGPNGIFSKAFNTPEAKINKSGPNHWRFNNTVYCFENIDTTELIYMTCHDFREKFKCGGNLTNMMNGERKSVMGWKITGA